MTTQLLRHITFMCIMLMLGAANLIIAPCTSKTWIFILDVGAAVYALLMAYICYRRALKIAKANDIPSTLIITIINHGEESESKGEAKEQAENEVKSGTDRENESEDYYSHPI